MMRLLNTIVYFWRFAKLVARSQLVWGVTADNAAEWKERVQLSPLKYEYLRLEEFRKKCLFGDQEW